MVTTMEIPNRYRSKAFAEKARESARMAKALEAAKREEQEAGRGTTYLLAVLCALVGISIFIKFWPWVWSSAPSSSRQLSSSRFSPPPTTSPTPRRVQREIPESFANYANLIHYQQHE